jgi:hypothetical protein
VDDGDAESAAPLEHPSGFSNRALEVVDVLERHERDHEIEGGVLEHQVRSVAQVHRDLGIRLLRGSDHRRRAVHADDLVAELLQVARQPPLAAPEVERAFSRQRHELEEQVSMELPVAV